MKPQFLKPEDPSWKQDKDDTDRISQTNFIYNPNLYLSIDQQRLKLPIFKNREHILYSLECYQCLIVVGETGSGKSTQVCQFLYEGGWAVDDKMIGVTEPRRVAVTTLASRVADEKSCNVGSLIGYSIRFDDKWSPDQTKIKFMTEGILIREMMADPLLNSYSVIMLDEVHERTLFTDIIMGLLKKILKRRNDLKLIVCSATVDANFLKDFFNLNKGKDHNKDTSTIMSIQGRTYPVEIYYLKEPVPDYTQACVETAIKIHLTQPPGDILVFLTGQEEVDSCCSSLQNYPLQSSYKLDILPMYGALPSSEQLKVFKSSPPGTRKVIIATNVAETSITIPGIVYVIDSGFVKLRWFNPKTQMDSLVIVPISKASAEQRAGRAGRVRSGKVYRLYSEEEFSLLKDFTPPEMVRSDLSQGILQIKALGIDNILRFNFPSPPPSYNMIVSLELLYALGALDENAKLTEPLGLQMAEFPLPPVYSKMLLTSGLFGCSEEILTIVSMLQVRNVYSGATGKSVQARVAKRQFEVEEGDLLTLLNVYNAYVKCGRVRSWCDRYHLNWKSLRRAEEIRNHMSHLLKRLGIKMESCGDNSVAVRMCITAASFPNAVYMHHSGEYRTVKGQVTLHVHPSSLFYNLDPPQWLVFAEVLHTNRQYMKDLTVIESQWLTELAPHYYEKILDIN